MNDITKSKHYTNLPKKSHLSGFISKVLLSIIFVLITLILSNTNGKLFSSYKKLILVDNFRFSKIKNIYQKYLGNVLPTKQTELAVFNEEEPYKLVTTDNGKEEMIFSNNSAINAFQSGIVVFVGEKEGLGNTVIIQGIDDVDVWYSNLISTNVKLYDYVSKDSQIGEASKLVIDIIKNDIHLKYDEYIKNI